MEINKDNWKQIDLNVDSLWLIPERDRQGKHKNIYHGNFVPQLLKRLRMPEIPKEHCVSITVHCKVRMIGGRLYSRMSISTVRMKF